MQRYHMTEVSGFPAEENEEEWGEHVRYKDMIKCIMALCEDWINYKPTFEHLEKFIKEN